GGANLDHGGAGDSFGTRENATGDHVAFAHDEDMSRVRLGNETPSVEHEGIIGAGIVRFDLGQNGIEQIGVMNLAIENLGRRAPDLARDYGQSSVRIYGRFVFVWDDQGRMRLIRSRIHLGSFFDSDGNSQSNFIV